MDATGALQVLGALAGMTGAVLNALPQRRPKLASFYVWLGGNTVLAAWSYATGNVWLLAMYAFYIVVALAGIYFHRR